MPRLAALVVVAGWLGQAAPVAALDWSIQEFAVDLKVLPQGGLVVRERITVQFDSPHHGIFRVIPVRYDVRAGFVHDLRIEFDAAVDPEGHVLPARVRRDGRNVHIRVGDPDATVSGRQTYILRYRVQNGVDFHPDHDELYWNLTGDEWPVPIASATARIELPQPVPEEKVSWEVFTGARGSRDRAADGVYGAGVLELRTVEPLPEWSGLTVAIGWPQGVVQRPSRLARGREFWRWNWPLLLPIPVGVAVWRRWRSRGRDPRTSQSVAVQYDPPAGLTPSELGTLVDERADVRDITAAVIDLAVRGYLRIEVDETRRFGVFKREEYTLVQLPPPPDAAPLKPHEATILSGLFETGAKVELEDLRARFYRHLPAIRRGIYAALVQAGLFEASPESVRGRWLGLGIALLVVGGLLSVGWVQLQGLVSPLAIVWPLIGVVLSASILIAVAGAMPRRTRRGVQRTLEARGLEEFIRRVENPRLELQERGGLDPRRQFERVLPYAMALGLGSRWAAAFADLYTTPPSWYVGPAHGPFSSLHFVNGLESMRGSMATQMTAAPRSTGGGSGLGGGGFSGGGHGGGGGGAW